MYKDRENNLIIATVHNDGIDINVPIFPDDDFYQPDTPVLPGTFLPIIEAEVVDPPQSSEQ